MTRFGQNSSGFHSLFLYSKSGNSSARVLFWSLVTGKCCRCTRASWLSLCWSSSSVAHWWISAQRLEVSCMCSTTPFIWGLRGLFQMTSISWAMSQSDKGGVASFAGDPKGSPLSTLNAPGLFLRSNICSKVCCTSRTGTWLIRSQGENGRF